MSSHADTFVVMMVDQFGRLSVKGITTDPVNSTLSLAYDCVVNFGDPEAVMIVIQPPELLEAFKEHVPTLSDEIIGYPIFVGYQTEHGVPDFEGGQVFLAVIVEVINDLS